MDVTRLVLGLPHLAVRQGEQSALEQAGPGWRKLAEAGKVFRLSPSEPSLTPEAAWLGLDPADWPIPQGPLTVAALGKEPPDRSLLAHLTLGSLNDLGEAAAPGPVTAEEGAEVLEAARALGTKRMTLLAGHEADHGLVWEDGPPEMRLRAWKEALGSPLAQVRPEGDGEDVMRALIDDSVNLLGGLELNRRRAGEGLPPLNLLWPWGQGLQIQAPSLPLRRGCLLRVASRSLRLQGLARMFGDQHLDWRGFGGRLKVNWAVIRAAVGDKEPVVAVLHPVVEMQAWERQDDLSWFLDQVEQELLKPLLLDQAKPSIRLTVLAPGDPWDGQDRALHCSEIGLGLNYDSRRPPGASPLPFDERVLDDKRAPLIPLHEALMRAVAGGPSGPG